MNTKQLKVFKIILFILGLAVIGGAFALANMPLPEEGLSANKKFFWGSLAFCYLIFFVPVFLTSINLKNFDKKIHSHFSLWSNFLLFDVVALVFAILVLQNVVKIRLALIVEMILFFFCLIMIYAAYFSGNHIGNVKEKEEKLLGKITEVKSTFEMLGMKADSWTAKIDNFSESQTRIKKLCDDVKYISPVDSQAAFSLEEKIIGAASAMVKTDVKNFDMDDFNEKLEDLEFLVKQRKALRN